MMPSRRRDGVFVTASFRVMADRTLSVLARNDRASKVITLAGWLFRRPAPARRHFDSPPWQYAAFRHESSRAPLAMQPRLEGDTPPFAA